MTSSQGQGRRTGAAPSLLRRRRGFSAHGLAAGDIDVDGGE
ncbi:TPA: hypothetical protein ACIT4J_004461 [Salmonella enterica subsp. enterica serovar Typhimurium]